MHCTLGMQYRSPDRKNQPNPRPRRRIMHLQRGLHFPVPSPSTQPAPKAQYCAPLVPITLPQSRTKAPNLHRRHTSVHPQHAIPRPRTGKACPTPAQGAILCALGAGYPSQERANSIHPSPRAQCTAPSARNTTTTDRKTCPIPTQGAILCALRRNIMTQRGQTCSACAESAKLCTLNTGYSSQKGGKGA